MRVNRPSFLCGITSSQDFSSAAHGLTVPVNAGEDKITKGYNSMDAMGCMLLRECKDEVDEVHTLLDISAEYTNTDEFTPSHMNLTC